MKPIIQVRDLKKDYYQYKVFFKGKLLTRAIRGISFDIYPSDFVGLIGVNGAGKSTLLRTLTTNIEKTSGKIIIAGYDIEKEQEAIKENISWMFGQDYFGVGWASLEKNMHLAAAFLGLDSKESQNRIDILLKRFNLDEKRDVDVWRLSSGMVAKYCLAVALLKNPKILFLDEPLIGLDTYAKDEIRSILKEANEKGTTIIYTDHQLLEVERMCKRLLIINEGKLIFDGSTKKLKQLYRDTNVLDIICTGKNINKVFYNLLKEKTIVDYDVLDKEGETFAVKIYTSIDSKKVLPVVTRLLQQNRLSIDHINAGLLSLEDVYRKFLKIDSNEQKAKKLEAFGRLEEEPLREFETLLQHSHPRIRARACRLFWKRNKKKVEPILLEMLSGPKHSQQEALNVIGQIKDKRFMEHVIAILKQKEIPLKNHAVIALAKMGNDTILPHLMKLLLEEETVAFVLQHIPEFDKNILLILQDNIHRLSIFDKSFLQHHCKLMKNSKKLLELLHLYHKDYRQWREEKFRSHKRE